MTSCSFPTTPLQGLQSVCININTQSLWLLRRSLRIDAQAVGIHGHAAAVFLQALLCRDLQSISINTQSPWFLHRGLRSDGQSESMQLQCFYKYNYSTVITGSLSVPWLCMHCRSHIVDRRFSIALCTTWIVDRTLHNVDCRLSIARCTMWIVDCRSHVAQRGL